MNGHQIALILGGEQNPAYRPSDSPLSFIFFADWLVDSPQKKKEHSKNIQNYTYFSNINHRAFGVLLGLSNAMK